MATARHPKATLVIQRRLLSGFDRRGRTRISDFALGIALGVLLIASAARAADAPRIYENKLTPIKNPKPLLADHPEWVEPIRETNRWEAPAIVNDPEADLHVRAWRWSYNARGIIEIPNHLLARQTAVIMVHPWGIDDGQGWDTPEPAGVADFCTPAKNHIAADRKSTRLNSSHLVISYAVFCLKKKTHRQLAIVHCALD